MHGIIPQTYTGKNIELFSKLILFRACMKFFICVFAVGFFFMIHPIRLHICRIISSYAMLSAGGGSFNHKHIFPHISSPPPPCSGIVHMFYSRFFSRRMQRPRFLEVHSFRAPITPIIIKYRSNRRIVVGQMLHY